MIGESIKRSECQNKSDVYTTLDRFRVKSGKADPLTVSDQYPLVLGFTLSMQPLEFNEPNSGVVYPKVMHR